MNLQYLQGDVYFTDINENKKQFPYLTENTEADVIIVGGGVTGALLGYYFSKAGVKSIILEKMRIAHGSTSATTALLQYELDSNANELLQYTTLDNVIRSYRLNLNALNEIALFIDEYGNDCYYEKKDTLLYTSKKLEAIELKKEYEIRKQAGFDVKFIDETNNPYPFQIYGGVYGINSGAQFDPYLFTHQLLSAGQQNGLRVYENTEVLKINYENNYVEVVTSYGYKVKAKRVIVATGYDIDKFTKKTFGTKTVTYNIVTEPIKNIDNSLKKILIRDNHEVYNYYRTTHDNRIIAGGEDTSYENHIFDEKTAQEKYSILEQKVKQLFPCTRTTKVQYKYCGAFASTNDDLGFIGPDERHDRLWMCLGYGANGILYAVSGAKMLVDLYFGKENSDMKLFDVSRF